MFLSIGPEFNISASLVLIDPQKYFVYILIIGMLYILFKNGRFAIHLAVTFDFYI